MLIGPLPCHSTFLLGGLLDEKLSYLSTAELRQQTGKRYKIFCMKKVVWKQESYESLVHVISRSSAAYSIAADLKMFQKGNTHAYSTDSWPDHKSHASRLITFMNSYFISTFYWVCILIWFLIGTFSHVIEDNLHFKHFEPNIHTWPVSKLRQNPLFYTLQSPSALCSAQFSMCIPAYTYDF